MASQLRALAVAAVLVAVSVILAPYGALYRMTFSAAHGNGEMVGHYVDSDAINAGLFRQMKGVFRDATGAPSLEQAKCLSTNLVSLTAWNFAGDIAFPDGLAELLSVRLPFSELHSGNGANGPGASPVPPPLLPGASFSHDLLDRFVVRLRNDRGDTLVLTLHRRGLQWVLTDVAIPESWALQLMPSSLLEKERRCWQGNACDCWREGMS